MLCLGYYRSCYHKRHTHVPFVSISLPNGSIVCFHFFTVHRDGETDDIPMYADELLRVSKERRGEKDDVLKWATMINGNLGGRVMTCFNLEKSLYFVPKD